MTGDENGTQSIAALKTLGTIDELKQAREIVREQRELLDNAEAAVRGAQQREQEFESRIRHLEGVVADREQLAAQLRTLQRENDPDRIKRAIADAVEVATADLRRENARVLTELSGAGNTINELRASKKKLREALERERNARK